MAKENVKIKLSFHSLMNRTIFKSLRSLMSSQINILDNNKEEIFSKNNISNKKNKIFQTEKMIRAKDKTYQKQIIKINKNYQME